MQAKKFITVSSMEELIKDIASRKIKSKKEAKYRFNAVLDNGIGKIAGLKKYTKNQNRTLNIFTLLKEIFSGSKTNDKADDETDNKIDEEQ